MSFRVLYLPVEAEVKPFGYDMFTATPPTTATTTTTTPSTQTPVTFTPATDVPVPSNYVIGPGDTLQLQLTGDAPGVYSLLVKRDGQVDVPQIGPVAVAPVPTTRASSPSPTAPSASVSVRT